MSSDSVKKDHEGIPVLENPLSMEAEAKALEAEAKRRCPT